MIRAVAALVSAILFSRPGMPKEQATHYANALNAAAKTHDFDPLLAVAIIHFETHWYPSMVSADGEDYGLGQVRARFVGACRDDVDPVHDPSEACRAAQAQLLDGDVNIQHMAGIIAANRALCKEKTGKVLAAQWLAGYQGYNDPDRNRWCTPGEKTARVLGYHKELLAALVPPPKAHPKPAAKAPEKKGEAKAKGEAGPRPSDETIAAETPKKTPLEVAKKAPVEAAKKAPVDVAKKAPVDVAKKGSVDAPIKGAPTPVKQVASSARVRPHHPAPPKR